MASVFAELSKIAAHFLKFDNCKTKSSILSHSWEVKVTEISGGSIKLDKDLPESIWSELQVNKTKVGFQSRCLVNPGLENPGYEIAEISSEMQLYEVYLSGYSKNKIVFNKFVEGAK